MDSLNDMTRRLAGAAAIALLLGACATAPDAPPPARIEIQDDVGFTITEEAKVAAEVRTDYQTALNLLEQERYEDGIVLLEDVVDRAPALTAPRIDLAIAYQRTDRLEAAEAHLASAMALTPEHPVIHNELGIIHRKKGEFDAARKSYERALSIYPGFHYARRNLAVLCDLYLADPECALANYEAYMETVPEDDEAAMWIADLRMRMER